VGGWNIKSEEMGSSDRDGMKMKRAEGDEEGRERLKWSPNPLPPLPW